MAITLFKEKKSKYYLILLLVIIFLLAISFVIWQNFFNRSAEALPQTLLKYYSEIKINFEVLKNPILKELQPFDEIKAFETEIGRDNPFMPY